MPPKDTRGKATASPPQVLLRGAGALPAEYVAEFHRYMRAINNTIVNAQGQRVVIDQATVTESMHASTSLGDPHSDLPRIGITLTNDNLMRQDGTTHLLHFRPDNPQYHYVYPQGYTRAQVTDMQNKRKKRRDAKKNTRGGGGGGPAGGRGGGAGGAGAGAGAGRGSTNAGAGRGGSTQTQQPAGRSSGTTGQGRSSGTAGSSRAPATAGTGRASTSTGRR